MPHEVDVHYFAAARELCGTSHERVALAAGETDVASFLRLLAQRHAPLARVIDRMRLAVNGEIAQAAQKIVPGDEVAVLPPVAGGGGSESVALCAVREQAIAVEEVLAAVRADTAGGIALFVGVVRDHAEGKPVARLDYEAHPSMAEREMGRVLAEVAAAHAGQGVRVAALHRVGTLAVGDTAVIVAASAAHRAEAFAACREAIEAIKARVPIWKKEWAPDGSANWVNLEK
jgi:molybdopterin synthase catalytic subunit